ncbi:hypothetical protein Tco_0281597 [Tanacetum coccineum]
MSPRPIYDLEDGEDKCSVLESSTESHPCGYEEGFNTRLIDIEERGKEKLAGWVVVKKGGKISYGGWEVLAAYTKIKDIDWDKVEIIDEVVEYVKHKYGKYNVMEDNSWSQTIFEDIYNTFFKDEAEADEEAELAKDRLEKAKSKLMVSEKGTKKASVDMVDALDLQNRIKKLSGDFNMLVKAKKTKEAKERPTTSRAPIASTSTTSRSIVLIASTFNAQAVFTALRGVETANANATQMQIVETANCKCKCHSNATAI